MELTKSNKLEPTVKQATYWGKKHRKIANENKSVVKTEQVNAYIEYQKAINNLPFEREKLIEIKNYIFSKIKE